MPMIEFTDAAVTISLASYTPEQFGDDLDRSLRDAGVKVEVVRRPPEFTNALEWIVPTAIMVLIGQKFFGTMLEEAAKDAYAGIKRRVSSLIRSVCGRDRVFDPKMVSAGGAMCDPYSNASLIVDTLTGKRVAFSFRLNLDAVIYDAAVAEFFRLSEAHYRRMPADPLVGLLKMVEHEPGNTIFMRFDSDSRLWQPIDTMIEARKAHERQKAERSGNK